MEQLGQTRARDLSVVTDDARVSDIVGETLSRLLFTIIGDAPVTEQLIAFDSNQ